MDLSGLSSLSTALSQARNSDSAAILVQKKAMDLETENAQALIQSLPQAASVSNPPHLGQNVDVKA